MNSNDEPQQPCENCSGPVAKALIDKTSSMCIPCASASLGITEPKPSSSQEKVLDTNESESNQLCQSDDYKDPGNSNDAGNIGTEDNNSVNGLVAGVEEDQKPINGPKRARPTAAKGGDGVKLTPACADCKRSKVRCTHRRTLGEDNDTSGETGMDGQAPPPAKRKKVRLRLNPEVVEENPESGSNFSPSPSKRQTRGVRKHKMVEIEDGFQNVTEVPAEEPSNGTRETSQQPPQKRSRRGRKPKNARPTEDTEEPSDTAQVPTGEPATDSRPPARLSFGADSLEGAGLLSRHVVLSRELQHKLKDCDIKWLAAIESLHEAKQTLDTWVEVWRSGL